MDNKIPSMTDVAIPLFVMAYLLGHQSEELRELGKVMLTEATISLVEYVKFQEHLSTCPRCALRRKLIDLLTADPKVSVPDPGEFV